MTKIRFPFIHIIKKVDLFGKRVNLRFEGEDYFKTLCGAFATIFMFLSLTLISYFSIKDIVKGKIESLGYMIKNTRVTNNSNFEDRQEVFGFAIEDSTLDSTFLHYEVGLGKRGKPLNKSVSVYKCNEEVYSRMSNRFSSSVPKNLTILCFNISSHALKNGYYPTVMFRECLDESKGCKPLATRDRLLREFYIWSFTLADETDFSQPKTLINSNFSASLISVSNWYFKRATLVLREVEIEIYTGLFVKHSLTKYTNIFLRTDLDIVSINKDEENMLELRLEHDMASKVMITKKFQSLSDLVAFLGGYSQGIMMLLLIIVFPVREISYYRKLINSMFSVCLDEYQLETAIKIFGAGDEDACENPEGKKDGGGAGGGIKKAKTIDKGMILKNLKRIGKRINKSRRKTRGALDQMMNQQEKITKEKFMENMQMAFQQTETLEKMIKENESPKKGGQDPNGRKSFTFTNLIFAGFGKYFKRESRLPVTISYPVEEQEGRMSRAAQTCDPRDNFVDGKMKELNIYETSILKGDVVCDGINLWLDKVKTNMKEKAQVGDKEWEKNRAERLDKELEDFKELRHKQKKRSKVVEIMISPQKSRVKNELKQNSKLIQGFEDDIINSSMSVDHSHSQISFGDNTVQDKGDTEKEDFDSCQGGQSDDSLYPRAKSLFGVKLHDDKIFNKSIESSECLSNMASPSNKSSEEIEEKPTPKFTPRSIFENDESLNERPILKQVRVKEPEIKNFKEPKIEVVEKPKKDKKKEKHKPKKVKEFLNKSKKFFNSIMNRPDHPVRGGLLDKFAQSKSLKSLKEIKNPKESGGGGDDHNDNSSFISEHDFAELRDEEKGGTKNNLSTDRPLITLNDEASEKIPDSKIPKQAYPSQRFKGRRKTVKFSIAPEQPYRQKSSTNLSRSGLDNSILRRSLEERQNLEFEKKFRKLLQKSEEMFQKSKDLKFNCNLFDYIRLFLPGIIDKDYTKRDLFNKVTPLYSNNGSLGKANDPNKNGNEGRDSISQRTGKTQALVVR